mgnify:CR=1 FL=1
MPGGTVYVIENLENGKKYIGQTTRLDLAERFREHCGNSKTSVCPKLRNAIKKYGKDCFSVEPLWTSETCEQEELDKKEMEEHDVSNDRRERPLSWWPLIKLALLFLLLRGSFKKAGISLKLISL